MFHPPSTWLLDLFLNNIWLAIALWAVLYCLDYIFTMTAARLYRDGAQQHYAFPEGIELNPFFRDDVAKIRTISFRFFLLLFFVVGLLLIIYELNIPEAFAVVWGMFVGIQLANHCRHIRNLVVFSYARRSAGVTGKIQYAHWLSLRLSSVDFFCFGVLFLLLFLLWGHLFVLGATLGCFSLALRHLIDSAKKRKSLGRNDSCFRSEEAAMRRKNWRIVIAGLVLIVIALVFFFFMLSVASKSNDPVALMQTVGTVAGAVGGISLVMIIIGLIGKRV